MSAPVREPEPDMSGVPLAPPTIGNGLLGVFERRYLLKLLVKREISARYQGSVLGLLWSYVNPLTQFLIYWGLMSGLLQLHKDLENFGIHIFAGMVVVHFFVETFGAGTRSIVRNRTIVKKMAMPREMFPVATMLVSLFHVGPQVVILAIACMFYGWVPDPVGMAAFLLAVVIISLLGTASALLFSAANVFFRDFANVVNILNHLVRFGVPMSAVFASATTSTSTGAVNSMHESFSPLGGGVLLFNMILGEVSPGGVGTGLYGALILVVLTVFVAGLMVGRTPELLGKTIGRREITCVALSILVMPALVLLLTGLSLVLPVSRDALLAQGPHGLTEMMYAFASASNNNGSAFAGLSADQPYLNLALALAMAAGRFLPIVLALALAGALAQQQRRPVTTGTMPTHSPLFTGLLIGITLVVAGLTFFPSFALGPLSEALS